MKPRPNRAMRDAVRRAVNEDTSEPARDLAYTLAEAQRAAHEPRQSPGYDRYRRSRGKR